MRAKHILRRLTAVILSILDIIPSATVILNPLLFIMYIPLGIYAVLVWPWTVLKDIPDPFHAGESLYWLAYILRTDDNILFPSLRRWGILDTAFLIIGSAIFLSAFVTWVANLKKKGLITTGIYRIIRHPQYLGLIVATFGISARSLRPISLIAWLTLTFGYLILASLEERDLHKTYGEIYKKYVETTPFMLPLVRVKLAALLSSQRRYRYMLLLMLYVLLVLTVVMFTRNYVVALRNVFGSSQS